MTNPRINKLLEQARDLTLEERRELCELLRQQVELDRAAGEEQRLDQLLLSRRIVRSRPRGKDPDRFNRWQPVQLEGKPLSETIIEERR
jgi:hypothetical protein